MGHSECDVCQRLWRAYSEGTNQHVRFINQQKDAAARRDFATVDRLEPEIRQLEKIRDAARDALLDHEGQAHRKAAAAGGTAEGGGKA